MAGIGGLGRRPFGAKAPRGRVRRARPPARTVCGSIVLGVLVLATPLIVVANPLDPTWLPGFYDDADTDLLVNHALSPENWLGATLPMVLCLLTSLALVRVREKGCIGADGSEQVAHRPPGLGSTPTTRVFSSVFTVSSAPPDRPTVSPAITRWPNGNAVIHVTHHAGQTTERLRCSCARATGARHPGEVMVSAQAQAPSPSPNDPSQKVTMAKQSLIIMVLVSMLGETEVQFTTDYRSVRLVFPIRRCRNSGRQA